MCTITVSKTVFNLKEYSPIEIQFLKKYLPTQKDDISYMENKIIEDLPEYSVVEFSGDRCLNNHIKITGVCKRFRFRRTNHFYFPTDTDENLSEQINQDVLEMIELKEAAQEAAEEEQAASAKKKNQDRLKEIERKKKEKDEEEKYFEMTTMPKILKWIKTDGSQRLKLAEKHYSYEDYIDLFDKEYLENKYEGFFVKENPYPELEGVPPLSILEKIDKIDCICHKVSVIDKGDFLLEIKVKSLSGNEIWLSE